jgi:hypothetical protein
MGNLSSAIGKAAVAQEAEPKEEAGQLAVDHAVAKAEFKELEMGGVVYEFPADMADEDIGVALDKVHYSSIGKQDVEEDKDPFSGSWNNMGNKKEQGKTPRGVWNNNPLNIEHNPRNFEKNRWEGEAGIEDRNGARFSKFEKAEDGLRAGVKVLQTYNKRGQNTVNSILFGLQDSQGNYSMGWAPPTTDVDTNPTDAYAKFVSAFMGVGRDQELNMKDPDTLQGLLKGMVRFENGKLDPYTNLEYNSAIKRGLGIKEDTDLIFENVMNLPDELLNNNSELEPGIYKNSAEEFFMVGDDKKVRKLGIQEEEGDPEQAAESAKG